MGIYGNVRALIKCVDVWLKKIERKEISEGFRHCPCKKFTAHYLMTISVTGVESTSYLLSLERRGVVAHSAVA